MVGAYLPFRGRAMLGVILGGGLRLIMPERSLAAVTGSVSCRSAGPLPGSERFATRVAHSLHHQTTTLRSASRPKALLLSEPRPAGHRLSAAPWAPPSHRWANAGRSACA